MHSLCDLVFFHADISPYFLSLLTVYELSRVKGVSRAIEARVHEELKRRTVDVSQAYTESSLTALTRLIQTTPAFKSIEGQFDHSRISKTDGALQALAHLLEVLKKAKCQFTELNLCWFSTSASERGLVWCGDYEETVVLTKGSGASTLIALHYDGSWLGYSWYRNLQQVIISCDGLDDRDEWFLLKKALRYWELNSPQLKEITYVASESRLEHYRGVLDSLVCDVLTSKWEYWGQRTSQRYCSCFYWQARYELVYTRARRGETLAGNMKCARLPART